MAVEGKRLKVKRPAGWYSKEQREHRRKARHERRLEREGMLAERRQRAENDRKRFERHLEQVAKMTETAAKKRVEDAPRLVAGITPLPGETDQMYQARVASLRLAVTHVRTLKRWDHKNDGTPQTHENASKTRQGPLARMYMAGHLTADQLGCACEIAAVAEAIERDVDIRCGSYEMRVDYSGSGRDVLVEGIMRVRREVAYGWWRERIPHPKRAILDMLIGEPQSYSSIAKQYRIGKARARMLLVDAIDLWPDAMKHAEREVDEATLAAAHSAILGG